MNTPNLVEHLAQLEYVDLLNNPKVQNARALRGNRLSSYLEPINQTPFTYLQKSVLTGTLLGDGTLRYSGGINAFLKVDQKAVNQVYVDFLYSVFEEMVGTPPRLRLVDGNPHSYWFRTFRSPKFEYFAQQFYKIDALGNRRKVIPPNIHQMLNPIALAIWFMDDGGKEESGYRLHTECFDLNEQRILQQALGNVFNLEINLRRDTRIDKVFYYLYIPAGSKARFNALVLPYILDCFRYKLI